MKTKFSWLGIVAILFACISTFFIACNNDLNDVVQYSGQVVYVNTTNPFSDLTVKVTNGRDTHCQTQTDAGGLFSLNVRVSEIDGNYYLLAGDSTCVPKKVALGGYGQAEVDLGVIEVEGPALPTVITHPIQSVSADEAILGGEVQTDGRLSVTARGVCYGTEQQPTIAGLHTTDGSGKGEFTSTLKDLERNTIYYARAYATNSKGTAYGEQIKFTTELGVPIVVTDSVYRVTVHTARCKGHVESDGGYKVTQRGTCWSQYPDPTLDDEFTNDGSDVGEFTSALNNLQENTTYYVRAYATNSTSTVYGEQKKISTLDGLATVITTNATTSATSVVINCEVTDDCGYTVTERGICYSTINSEPSIEDAKKANGKGKGSYNVSVTELSASTTYYVRAYAINEYGVAYSTTRNVITSNGIPTVSLETIKNITDKTASSSVRVTDTGGATLQTCGICWSTTQNPTIENSSATGGNIVNTEYNCNLANLLPSTTYYVRAYATTDITTSYSQQRSFQTISGLPSVTTYTTTATSTNITSGGRITNNGGYNITECGVCFSTTNSNPTIDGSHVTSSVVTDEFSATITDVLVSTTYYVRAYATNSVGTAYGDVVSVTTGNGLPSVTTTDVGENVTATSAVSGGQVIDDGGYIITNRGVCWSTLPYPTINDNKTNDGGGMGYYSSSITNINLQGSNIYYIRAYATNVNGTSYGEQVSISKTNLDYKNLPLIEYGGYLYRVYYDLGKMIWSSANQACEDLVFCGYDDWILPTEIELQQIMTVLYSGWYTNNGQSFNFISRSNYNRSCVQSAMYWTSTGTYQKHKCVYYPLETYTNGGIVAGYYNGAPITSTENNADFHRVRPVRKYLANQ